MHKVSPATTFPGFPLIPFYLVANDLSEQQHDFGWIDWQLKIYYLFITLTIVLPKIGLSSNNIHVSTHIMVLILIVNLVVVVFCNSLHYKNVLSEWYINTFVMQHLLRWRYFVCCNDLLLIFRLKSIKS